MPHEFEFDFDDIRVMLPEYGFPTPPLSNKRMQLAGASLLQETSDCARLRSRRS